MSMKEDRRSEIRGVSPSVTIEPEFAMRSPLKNVKNLSSFSHQSNCKGSPHHLAWWEDEFGRESASVPLCLPPATSRGRKRSSQRQADTVVGAFPGETGSELGGLPHKVAGGQSGVIGHGFAMELCLPPRKVVGVHSEIMILPEVLTHWNGSSS